MDDSSLIDELRRGSTQAAERLMQRHNQKLWRIARSILRNDSDAEEVVQEAYLRAFTRIDEFRGHSSLGTWLARITINEALRRLGTTRAVAEMLEPDAPTGVKAADPVSPPPPSPEQMAARSEIRRIIERAIDALPQTFRLVFTMRVLEQMSIDETASALSIPAATVKTRLHRANQQLRQALGTELAAALDGAFPFAGPRCERLTGSVLSRLDGSRAVHLDQFSKTS